MKQKTGETINLQTGTLSVQQVRQILGSKYMSLSDQEVDQIRISFEILARIAINSFKNKPSIEKVKKNII